MVSRLQFTVTFQSISCVFLPVTDHERCPVTLTLHHAKYLLLARQMGQYCFARWCLSSSVTLPMEERIISVAPTFADSAAECACCGSPICRGNFRGKRKVAAHCKVWGHSTVCCGKRLNRSTCRLGCGLKEPFIRRGLRSSREGALLRGVRPTVP